jgi:hypothetical protein
VILLALTPEGAQLVTGYRRRPCVYWAPRPRFDVLAPIALAPTPTVQPTALHLHLVVWWPRNRCEWRGDFDHAPVLRASYYAWDGASDADRRIVQGFALLGFDRCEGPFGPITLTNEAIPARRASICRHMTALAQGADP